MGTTHLLGAGSVLVWQLGAVQLTLPGVTLILQAAERDAIDEELMSLRAEVSDGTVHTSIDRRHRHFAELCHTGVLAASVTARVRAPPPLSPLLTLAFLLRTCCIHTGGLPQAGTCGLG